MYSGYTLVEFTKRKSMCFIFSILAILDCKHLKTEEGSFLKSRFLLHLGYSVTLKINCKLLHFSNFSLCCLLSTLTAYV